MVLRYSDVSTKPLIGFGSREPGDSGDISDIVDLDHVGYETECSAMRDLLRDPSSSPIHMIRKFYPARLDPF
jgi:hypothetical protein